jgi:hypothetical protein
MTVARTVADVLADHVMFEIECIDQMYCNVHVPQLQYAGGLLGYIQRQLGLPIASTAPPGKITDAFSAAMRRFARDQQVPWVDFTKAQRKDDVMRVVRPAGAHDTPASGQCRRRSSSRSGGNANPSSSVARWSSRRRPAVSGSDHAAVRSAPTAFTSSSGCCSG